MGVRLPAPAAAPTSTGGQASTPLRRWPGRTEGPPSLCCAGLSGVAWKLSPGVVGPVFPGARVLSGELAGLCC